MRTIVATLLAFLVSVNFSWAYLTYTTDPTSFTDTLNWDLVPSFNNGNSGSWVSTQGATGAVYGSNNGTAIKFIQGVNYYGGYTPGMSVLWNSYIGTSGDFNILFNSLQHSVGAYMESYVAGPYNATITIYDGSYNVLGNYSVSGDRGNSTAAFLGIIDSNQEIALASFHVDSNNFTLGTVSLNATSAAVVPEPSTYALLCISLGVVGFARKRMNKKP